MPAPELAEFSLVKSVSYAQEIQKMMYGFGDCKLPEKETVELVEKIVREQMLYLIDMVSEIAAKQEAKKIGIKQFIFLLRHNPVKLRRFCTYLQVTDFKKLVDTADDDTDFGEFQGIQAESKKLQTALHYLQHIDPTGYLASVADPRKPSMIPDEALRERNQRIEAMTATMDAQQYIDYAKAKSTSFKRNQPLGKFQEWLTRENAVDTALTMHSWAILSYFAYETVAQIIDLAFLVRRDAEASDPLERNKVPRVSAFNADLSKSGWPNSLKPLQAAEVMEAMRRFNDTQHCICTPFTRARPGRRNLLGL